MKKNGIWLSYDVGVRGDYEGLYAWLDTKGAIECGDSFAFFYYECGGNVVDSIRKELGAAIDVGKRTRIYIVYRDSVSNKIKGTFIFGTRKASPWTGYAGMINQTEEEEV